MATVTQKLTFEEFQLQYGRGDRVYEFWYGEARPKGVPTWVHGLLQRIVLQLLTEAGFESAPEVELRIEFGAHPRPDVIATKTQALTDAYPTQGLDVVVEIISEDDTFPNVREHCRKYQEWGFGKIYLVDPSDRSVSEWQAGATLPARDLTGIPVERIWKELDRALERSIRRRE